MSQFAKNIFKHFKDNGILWQSRDFTGLEGSFHAYIQEEAANTLQFRDDYADPKRAFVRPRSRSKVS